MQTPTQPPATGKRIGMFDDERANPWRAFALYGAFFFAGMFGAHIVAWVRA